MKIVYRECGINTIRVLVVYGLEEKQKLFEWCMKNNVKIRDFSSFFSNSAIVYFTTVKKYMKLLEEWEEKV